MVKTKIIIGVVIIVILIVLGFIVFNKSSTATIKPINNIQLTGETKEFTIEAFQFGFSPSTIKVNQGDKVRIIASSRDVPHGLAIPEFGVNMYLPGPAPKTIEFIADKKGTFTFYCNIPCGSGHSSMRGQLIIK